jgi:hypothetical protein
LVLAVLKHPRAAVCAGDDHPIVLGVLISPALGLMVASLAPPAAAGGRDRPHRHHGGRRPHLTACGRRPPDMSRNCLCTPLPPAD